MKYDYIIIGGGSSGCVTANKLISNEAKVLILEEGGDYKNPFLKMPAGFIPMLDGSPYHRFHKTIPQQQLNGRQHDIAQGKILGGGSMGRLFQNIREDKAYTYGAYSSYDSDELVGEFSASASVRNEVTDSAIVEFIKEFERLIYFFIRVIS